MWESSCTRWELSGETQFAVVPPVKSGSCSGTLQNTLNHRHSHGLCWRKWLPNAPNETSSPTTVPRMDGRGPPEQAGIIWGGGLMGCMALKALLCSCDAVLLEQRIRIVLWGPYIPTTFKKLCSLAQGVFPHQAKTMEQGASPHMSCKGAILTGVGHGQLWIRLVIVGHWRLVTSYYISFLRRLNTMLTSDPAS